MCIRDSPHTHQLKAVEQSLGPDSVEALDALDELASVNRAEGRILEATQIMRRALNKREVALPEQDERTIQSCENLGLLFAQEGANLEGGLEAAQTLLERRQLGIVAVCRFGSSLTV